MLIDCEDLAMKYDLDTDYVMSVMNVRAVPKHINIKISPFHVYDEKEAVKAILDDMREDADKALLEHKRCLERAEKLEKQYAIRGE